MQKPLTFMLLALSLQAATYDNKLEFGLKTTAYNYTERGDQDQILDTEDSKFLEIGGFYGSYDHKFRTEAAKNSEIAYYLNFYGSYTGGDTDYKGSLLGGGSSYGSYSSTTENKFYELQVNIKRLRQYENKSSYTMLGMGYKSWERKLSSNQEETYYYYFFQVAFGGEVNIYKDWSLGLDLTGQLAYNPKMDADFSSASNQKLNETFDLGTVYTYKIAAPLVIPINKQLSFKTKLEYEFTSYGKSNTKYVPNFPDTGNTNSYLEPKSQQKNWHLYAGFQLIF